MRGSAVADPTWKKNFAKRNPNVNPVPAPEPVVAPPQKKAGKTCGNPNCCMRPGGRDQITYSGPTMLDGNGNERGGYTFKGIEPPMLCGGTAWMPKQLSNWEKRREEAKAAPGLTDFKKKR